MTIPRDLPSTKKGGVMDPEATFRVVTDDGLSLSERTEAASNLLAWLAKGGAVPDRTSAIEAASQVLADAVDAIAGAEVDEGAVW